MRRTITLQFVRISLLLAVIFYCVEAFIPCTPEVFMCDNLKCIKRSWFCDGTNDCGDNSDERYCSSTLLGCPSSWTTCPNQRRCIRPQWVCDGIHDCPSVSEERNCGSSTTVTTSTTTTTTKAPITTKKPDNAFAKSKLRSWFLNKRKSGSRIDKWGPEIHRIAVALHLSDESTFRPGNNIGEEIRYELTIQLLQRLRKNITMSSQELALYIDALVVSCLDPNDFHGDDLVLELRKRVDAATNYTNPYLMLSLCNAGENMKAKDFERVTAAYDSQHRPFWTDAQALASMALSCLSSNSDVFVDERFLKDMLQELKRHQFLNGTVDNYKTTALVTQALFIHHSYTKDFDFDSAIKILVDGLNNSISLLNAYYVIPALHHKSLLNITSSHCIKQPVEEEEALQKALEVNGETIIVQYSVWLGDEINLSRTWRLKMKTDSTIYDAIETVAKIDNRQKVEYNVVEGKPYVTQLNGKEDDPQRGTFWFIYLKNLSSDEDPKIVEESPVDIKLKANQEIILWYKFGPWNSQNMMRPVTSS